MPTLALMILSLFALGLVVTLNMVPSFNLSLRAQPGTRRAKRWPGVERTKPAAIGFTAVLVGELAVLAGNYALLARYPSSRGALTTLATIIVAIGSVVYGFRHTTWT